MDVEHFAFRLHAPPQRVGVNAPGFTGLKLVQQSPDLFVPMILQPIIDPKGKTSLLGDPRLWRGVSDLQAQSALNFGLQGAVHST